MARKRPVLRLTREKKVEPLEPAPHFTQDATRRNHAMTNTRTLLASLLTAAVFAGVAAPQEVEGASSSNALVRVEVTDNDAGTKARKQTAVAWSSTAAMKIELGGHAHALSITPHSVAGGVTLDFDHSRDGVVVSDDLHLDTAERRFVIENAHTTVVVTVLAVKTTVAAG
jgi:hypothetical protein